MKATLSRWASTDWAGKAGLAASQLGSHLRIPLYRNGYALLLSSATTSGLGLFYWVLAARFYPTEVVGINSAAISTLLFLSGAAQLSLNGALVRFLPVAGPATRRFTAYTYLVSLAAAALAGLVFILGLHIWSPSLKAYLSSPPILASFVFAILAWNIFSLQDSVLTGLRQAVWIPLENTIFAAGKIVLLIFFATFLQQYGIFVSWMIPVIVLLAPVNTLIFKRLIPVHIQATREQALPLAPVQILKYVAGNYLGSLFLMASTALLPLLVTEQAGASANAHFYLPWMIANALQLVAVNMTTSLTVEATRDQQNLWAYGYHVLVHSTRLLAPLIVLILLGAPYILRIMGSSYEAEGTALLRLLAIATIPNFLVTLYISLARVRNQIRGIVLVHGSQCILVLGLSYLLLQISGISGVGIAWLASQSLLAGILLLTALRPVVSSRNKENQREQL